MCDKLREYFFFVLSFSILSIESHNIERTNKRIFTFFKFGFTNMY